jgi:hypothetical protein
VLLLEHMDDSLPDGGRFRRSTSRSDVARHVAFLAAIVIALQAIATLVTMFAIATEMLRPVPGAVLTAFAGASMGMCIAIRRRIRPQQDDA